VSFYNLEVNPDRGCPRPKIAQAIEGGLNLIDYSGALVSFDDTAALIANLDVVLGCETAVTHLAGALGKPTWVMVDFNTHWVWGREGNRTPWYPSARIFCQQRIHQWEEVFAEVRLALLGKERSLPSAATRPRRRSPCSSARATRACAFCFIVIFMQYLSFRLRCKPVFPTIC
jgi:hypothetical protein